MKRLVLLFAVLLVATCGEKSLSDADIERALKKAIDVDDLQQREGAYYEANKQDGYNGWVKLMYSEEQAVFLAQIKDGKKHGTYIEWWSNGWKKKQETYQYGAGNGPYLKWHLNGQLAERGNLENGSYVSAELWNEKGERQREKLTGLPAIFFGGEWEFREELRRRGLLSNYEYNSDLVTDKEFLKKHFQELAFLRESAPNVAPAIAAAGLSNLNKLDPDDLDERLALMRREVRAKMDGAKQLKKPLPKPEGKKSLSDADIERLLKEAVEFDSLQYRDGLLYQANKSEPYSGWAKWIYDSEQPKALFQFKDGKEDGLATEWHENGQKKLEVTFKDGKSDGPSRGWYENGQKMVEGFYKGGELDGLTTTWHENGQKRSETTFKDGEGVSAKGWNRKGTRVETAEEARK